MSQRIRARDVRRLPGTGRCAGVIVVSNNPLMKDVDDVLFVEGSFHDVLVKVRDMVFEGYELVTHPLFASIGMMWSPFRSVILGERRDKSTEFELRTVEDALRSYDQVTEGRVHFPEHDRDYAWMDRSLYYSALEELGMLDKVGALQKSGTLEDASM